RSSARSASNPRGRPSCAEICFDFIATRLDFIPNSTIHGLTRFVHADISYRAVQKFPRKRSQQMSKLAGKVALVTGGNGGIGLATAKRFVAEGATVFITGRRKEQLDEAIREIGKGAIAIQG